MRWTRAVALVLVAMAVAGCGSAATDIVSQDRLADALAAVKERPMPSKLIGQWAVAASSAEPGTVVNLGGRDAAIFLECGEVDASYAARPGGAFVAAISSGSSDCFSDETPIADYAPGWLYAASAFVIDGDRRRLLDTAGEVVATLTPARRSGLPQPVVDFVPSPPFVSAEERLDVEPAPVPPGLRPATRGDLIGTWVLPDDPPGGWGADPPHVQFKEGNVYEDLDGCNWSGGRWTLVGAHLLYTTGISTLIGCHGATLLGGVASAAFDGPTLVFLNEQGELAWRLVRGCVPTGKSWITAGPDGRCEQR